MQECFFVELAEPQELTDGSWMVGMMLFTKAEGEKRQPGAPVIVADLEQWRSRKAS